MNCFEPNRTENKLCNLSVDKSTNALNILNYPHGELHVGCHFSFTATTGNLDAAQSLDYIMVTPDTPKYAHLLAEGYGALHTRLEMYEDTTHTTGTLQKVYNNNRNCPSCPTSLITKSNGDGENGTLVFESEFGTDRWFTGGDGGRRLFGGGENRSDSEWILKRNSKYLISVLSLSNNNVASLTLEWCEHIDKV